MVDVSTPLSYIVPARSVPRMCGSVSCSSIRRGRRRLDDDERVRACPAQIAKVIYPGLPSHPAHGRAQELFKQGFGGMLAFEVKGGVAAAKAFLETLTLPLEAPR